MAARCAGAARCLAVAERCSCCTLMLQLLQIALHSARRRAWRDEWMQNCCLRLPARCMHGASARLQSHSAQ